MLFDYLGYVREIVVIMNSKQKILDYIENNKYDYIEISHRIHERPELGNEEIFASRILIEKLAEQGFEIEISQVMQQDL